MNGAKANWHIQPAVVDDAPDPFSMPIEEVGERIDLGDPENRLNIRLRELVRREGTLYRMDVTCPIKDDEGSSCHACPMSRAHVSEEALAHLCRLGREQERVLTELAILQVQHAATVGS
jgi:hypothetical protein